MSNTNLVWPLSLILLGGLIIVVLFLTTPHVSYDGRVEAYPIATSTATTDPGTPGHEEPWPAQLVCGSWMFVDPTGKGRPYPAPNPDTGALEYGVCLPLVVK